MCMWCAHREAATLQQTDGACGVRRASTAAVLTMATKSRPSLQLNTTHWMATALARSLVVSVLPAMTYQCKHASVSVVLHHATPYNLGQSEAGEPGWLQGGAAGMFGLLALVAGGDGWLKCCI